MASRCSSAGAGAAAHLAGVTAAHTLLPVLGVPLDSSALQGLDALLATVQMPGGIPVATFSIGKAGARRTRRLFAGCDHCAQRCSGYATKLEQFPRRPVARRCPSVRSRQQCSSRRCCWSQGRSATVSPRLRNSYSRERSRAAFKSSQTWRRFSGVYWRRMYAGMQRRHQGDAAIFLNQLPRMRVIATSRPKQQARDAGLPSATMTFGLHRLRSDRRGTVGSLRSRRSRGVRLFGGRHFTMLQM